MTYKKDEALKLALEALEEIHPGNMTPMAEEAWNKAITAIREALAEQPAQQEWPKPKFVRNVDGVPCITLVEHEYLMRSRTSKQPAYRAVKTFHEGNPVYVAEQPAQQQEPVAWLYPDNLGRKIVWLGAKKPIIPRPSTAEPLYTTPQPAKQHIEHCIWARNGHQPCPNVQPAPVAEPHKQQEPVSWDRFMSVEKELQDMTAEFMRVAKELAALKTQQQEPVAWLHPANATCVTTDPTAYARGIPLYTSPPASKPWVGLTDEERNDLEDYCEMIIGKAAFEAIEAKLKEKNA